MHVAQERWTKLRSSFFGVAFFAHGTAVTWGDVKYGGDSSKTKSKMVTHMQPEAKQKAPMPLCEGACWGGDFFRKRCRASSKIYESAWSLRPLQSLCRDMDPNKVNLPRSEVTDQIYVSFIRSSKISKLIQLFNHSFIRSFLNKINCSFLRLFIHSFIHSFTHSFSVIPPFTCIHSFFFPPLFHSFLRLFSHSSDYSDIHFIHVTDFMMQSFSFSGSQSVSQAVIQ